MSRVQERRFFGLGARQWAVAGACFGAWAIAVQGIVSWTTTAMGG